jgi:hypothetical protein
MLSSYNDQNLTLENKVVINYFYLGMYYLKQGIFKRFFLYIGILRHDLEKGYNVTYTFFKTLLCL